MGGTEDQRDIQFKTVDQCAISLHDVKDTPVEGPSPEEIWQRSSDYRIWMENSLKDQILSKNSLDVAFKDLNVYGIGTPTDYQKTILNFPSVFLNRFWAYICRRKGSRIDILRDFEGLVKSGEMLIVLGKPGSGCTTLLKTLAGQVHGFYIDPKSSLTYQGIPHRVMHTKFRNMISYQAEQDTHLPQLTVMETLNMAAQAKMSESINDRKSMAREMADAVIAALGLSHTKSIKVGNDFIQGISGGERKRTSIAECLLTKSSLQCWDNSTRGLDSANALNFVKVLRASTKVTGSAQVVTMYQASQTIYDEFDKVILLYEGQQIYFGKAADAKEYFTNMGFRCPPRASCSDFLTSLTNATERLHLIQPGWELKVPRNATEFTTRWKNSVERSKLIQDICKYQSEHLQIDSRTMTSSSNQPQQTSLYVIALREQVRLCIIRGFQRLKNDIAPPISSIAGNAILSIILGSMFYNMPNDTSSFFGRGVLIFFVVLTNTFLGAFEGVQLWDYRPIVEKHFQYAFYHPIAEAIASMICDLPNKVLLTTAFNVPFYFIANMRRTPSAFFIFYFFAFVSLVTGSMLFRTIGAISKTLTSSIAPGADFILMLVIYTGFVLPTSYMHPWFRWFAYIDPVAYAFESLMINEFSDRQFPCITFVPQGPSYADANANEKMCTTVGALPGSSVVDGNTYLATSFQYYPDHLWRNLGIIFGIMVFLCICYLVATEYISARRSKGEILIFQKHHLPKHGARNDEEAQILYKPTQAEEVHIPEGSKEKQLGSPSHAASFIWEHMFYKINSKIILEDIEGWVKPGSLVALMGASGAGKTSLLNVLANRAT
ncbi:abc transporter cdr4 protein [Rutstroemia sp. NJR-2017a WRK4]|nr:abc transporter cdr4 protein [Rutstroemia sp. NJR-2017a WRK4]